MTDVTGFGLAGHLAGMLEASGAGARLDLAALPVLAGAQELIALGLRSTLHAENAALREICDLPDTPRAELLFDPQTAGGLLAALPPERADRLVARLRAEGHPAARIGEITEGPPRIVAG